MPQEGGKCQLSPVAVIMEKGALCARHSSGPRGRAPPQELPAETGGHTEQQKGAVGGLDNSRSEVVQRIDTSDRGF